SGRRARSLDQLHDARRAERLITDLGAERRQRVADRVDDARRRRDRTTLAEALVPTGIAARRSLDVVVLDLGDLGRRREQVVDEGRGQGVARIVGGPMLEQDAPEPLAQAAGDVAPPSPGWNHDAAVPATARA